MVLAMHAGFAFLEVGTVRKKIRLMHWLRLLWILLFQPSVIFLLAIWWLIQ